MQPSKVTCRFYKVTFPTLLTALVTARSLVYRFMRHKTSGLTYEDKTHPILTLGIAYPLV